MSLEILWAGWRSEYVADAETGEEDCVLCRVLAASDDDAQVVKRGSVVDVVLNAYPYTSGHMMVMPKRHVASLEDLDAAEFGELWRRVTEAVVALKGSYEPHGLNIGTNLGTAAGAGVPGHLHVHVLPRWHADTNFATTIANLRVVPEALAATRVRLIDAWPN